MTHTIFLSCAFANYYITVPLNSLHKLLLSKLLDLSENIFHSVHINGWHLEKFSKDLFIFFLFSSETTRIDVSVPDDFAFLPFNDTLLVGNDNFFSVFDSLHCFFCTKLIEKNHPVYFTPRYQDFFFNETCTQKVYPFALFAKITQKKIVPLSIHLIF